MPQFSIEPSIALNWVSLPDGDFTARLVSSRFTVTPSARMLISSLVQYNVDSHNISSSARLRWEYTGGSELFVVYSDGRDTAITGFALLQNRTAAIKVTRLVRFQESLVVPQRDQRIEVGRAPGRPDTGADGHDRQ